MGSFARGQIMTVPLLGVPSGIGYIQPAKIEPLIDCQTTEKTALKFFTSTRWSR